MQSYTRVRLLGALHECIGHSAEITDVMGLV